MSEYSSLKATINANVKTNDNHEITGSIMNSVLNAMVNSLGAGYQFIGVATPTNPGSAQTPDYKCFYLATIPGTYTNLGGLVVADGEVALLKWDTSWTKEVTGVATADQVSQLGQEVVKLDIGTLVSGEFVYTPNGKFLESASYKRTSFVYVGGLKKIKVYIGVSSNNVGGAFYTSNDVTTFISGSGINTADYSVGDVAEIDVPSNAKYVAFCCLNANAPRFFISIANIPNEIIGSKKAEESLRESINETGAAVTTLGTKIIAFAPVMTVGGGYVDYRNGLIVESASYNHSDFIKTFGSNIQITAFFSSVAGVAFYDEFKNYISGYSKPSETPSGELVTIAIPSNSVYFRVSCSKIQQSNFKLYTNSDDVVGDLVNTIGGRDGYVKSLMQIPVTPLSNARVRSGSGIIDDYEGGKCTGMRKINAKRIAVCVVDVSTLHGLAFYDKNKNFIVGSGIGFGNYPVLTTIIVDVPSNAYYFAYSAIDAYAPNMKVYNLDLAESINLCSRHEDVNPCNYTLSRGAQTFKKVLCIGDSLTEGAFEYKEDDVLIPFIDQGYSWPTIFANISGRQTTNAGDSGESIVSWWNRHQNDNLTGHDCCVIALGRNDYSSNPTTSEERRTALTNIINKVKADNPQIKIFVSTLINYYTGADADAVNADIVYITTNTPDCYLVDIHTYGEMVATYDRYSHCTAVGYSKLATYYFNYISYIMATNPAEFMTIQFTGTNRHFNP